MIISLSLTARPPAQVLAHRLPQTLKAVLVPGNTFNLNLNGAIDQSQDTFTFTISSDQNSQLSISTPQQISLNSNNSGNNNNNNNNNGNNSNNNNNSGGVNPVFLKRTN